MAFTVAQLKEALETFDVPDEAVVMIEFGDYVRAAEKLAVVQTPEFPIFAIQGRPDVVVN